MNRAHLELCSSAEWAEMIETRAIPWVTDGVQLGDDVLEIGAGPGAATAPLRGLVRRLTALELDPELCALLAGRFSGTNVAVVRGDAALLPFGTHEFSGAASFTMLHHVPSAELQDRLFGEVGRVLRPGGVFAGSDSLDSAPFRDLHEGDVCVPVDPATLADRLRRAGFASVDVTTLTFDDSGSGALRFRAVTAG